MIPTHPPISPLDTHEIPLGLCQCGCGQATTLAQKTNRKLGHVKGQAVRYLRGHSHRLSPEQQNAKSARKRAYYKRWCKANRDRLRATNKRYAEANREQLRAKAKQRREANRERYKPAKTAWYVANAEYVKAQRKALYEANRERAKAAAKAWRAANLERHKASVTAWKEANPERLRELKRTALGRRRARKQNLEIEIFTHQEIWERDRGICGICGMPASPTSWHLDHIVPQSQQGPHTRANVQVSHPQCNQKKWAHLSVPLSPAPPASDLTLG